MVNEKRSSALMKPLTRFRPTVEEANARAPTHSRIFREVCYEFVIAKMQLIKNE